MTVFNSFGELVENAQYSETPNLTVFNPEPTDNAIPAVGGAGGMDNNSPKIPQWHKDLKTEVATLREDTKRGFAELRADIKQLNVDIKQIKDAVLPNASQDPPANQQPPPQSPPPQTPQQPPQNPPGSTQSWLA